jgi:FMN-dependent NADH-azoreductase
MTKVLHIEASPKGSRSGSSQLAAWFLSAYRDAHPEDEVEVLNVFEADLPPFGEEAATAKFAAIFQEKLTDPQTAVWEQVKERIADFDACDKLVLSSPMWNYSIPYRLKHYLDILVQPILTFGYDFEKMMHVGLLENRPVQLFLTRSSTPPGDYADFQLPYLRYVLGSIGLRDIRVTTAWQTTQPSADARSAYLEGFRPECETLGAKF